MDSEATASSTNVTAPPDQTIPAARDDNAHEQAVQHESQPPAPTHRDDDAQVSATPAVNDSVQDGHGSEPSFVASSITSQPETAQDDNVPLNPLLANQLATEQDLEADVRFYHKHQWRRPLTDFTLYRSLIRTQLLGAIRMFDIYRQNDNTRAY